MNSRVTRLVANTVVVLLLLSWGQGLHAQSATPAKPAVPANSPAAAGLLTQAYTALSAADHDYQGHRVRAMKQIEAAAKELGTSLQGDGHNKEQQGTSDQQLRTAQGLLQQALAAGLRPRPAMHVQKALDQLTTALSIK